MSLRNWTYTLTSSYATNVYMQLGRISSGNNYHGSTFKTKLSSYIDSVSVQMWKSTSTIGLPYMTIWEIGEDDTLPSSITGYLQRAQGDAITTGAEEFLTTFSFSNLELKPDKLYAFAIENSNLTASGDAYIFSAASYSGTSWQTEPGNFIFYTTLLGWANNVPAATENYVLNFNIQFTTSENGKTEKLISNNNSLVFRRAYVKRKSASTGLYETSWQEITKDVKKWGSININTDVDRIGRVSFSGTNLVMQNMEGKYNPNSNTFSMWYGYADMQRSLVKIEAGFYDQFEIPGQKNHVVTEVIPSDPTIFVGILSGAINVSDDNEITLPIKPLNQVFRDYLAADLTGYTAAGPGLLGTSENFIDMIWNQTDGSSNFVFRPFFNNTLSYWQVSIGSGSYPTYPMLTGSVSQIGDVSVWEVLEKMAEAENFIPYIDRTGSFRWRPKEADSISSFKFYGLGIFNGYNKFGHTIKKIDSYGEKISDYYNRVTVSYLSSGVSAFVATGTALAVSGSNDVWNLGRRPYTVDNDYIGNSTTAQSVANSLLTELSSRSSSINFSTSFIPHLDLLNRVTVSYDAADISVLNSLWDTADWDTVFTWDPGRGDAINLTEQQFKIISININLDNLETRFVGKQI